jgi:hypothetical protein
MFAWLLTNRRRARKSTAELLSKAIATLEESRQLNQKLAGLADSQGAQLVDVCAENARLWTALSAPKELQPYIAAGCSQSEAEQLAKEAPRGA